MHLPSPFEQKEFLRNATDVLGVDTEGTGFNLLDGRDWGYGISIAYWSPVARDVVGMYFPYRHTAGNCDDEVKELVKQTIENARIVATHNVKYDIPALASMGIQVNSKSLYCTLQMAHLLDETAFNQSLDSCVKTYLKIEGKVKSPEFEGWIKAFGWANPMPVGMIYEYAVQDAILHYKLFRELEEIWTRREPDLWNYWRDLKQEFTHVILKMESRGIRVDQALCKRMVAIGEARMDELLFLLGYEKLGNNAYQDLLIDKLGLPVVKTSKKTGKPSFDKEAMEFYDQILERRDSDIAKWILEYRGWQKSVSSNYRAYIELVSPDGRVRCNYKLHGTKTGRLSCEKPNLQQIPRSGDKDWNGLMKQCFVPDPGFTLWEVDYSQLELRIATGYGDVKPLKQVFSEGRDIFTEMSEQLGMVRHDTKTLTYTIQYGGGIARLSAVFGVSPERARQIRENFFQTYPGFKRISDYAAAKARSTGKVQLWTKRFRHFKWPESEAHKAFNAVVQGGAADIVNKQMVRLFNEVDNEDECRMLLQVHDSVVFEIKNGTEDKYLSRIVEIMEDVENGGFNVRFAVDCHKWGTEDKWVSNA